jgi:8-oxo-dGTP pyrophosphatase MutT (NUDIX family)
MSSEPASELLHDPHALQVHIEDVLWARLQREPASPPIGTHSQNAGGPVPLLQREPASPYIGAAGVIASSVLFLLSPQTQQPGHTQETCLILTKRSRQVRQGGDLCCPGGIVEARLDSALGKLLRLPLTPLTLWPHWLSYQRLQPQFARNLALLFAAGLRESWEELRLNPFRVRFLGPLPEQRLILFHRVIHPLVGWVARQRRFFPSWEVDRIVSIPLRDLLNPANYCRYRLYVAPHLEERLQRGTQDFPCFLHHQGGRTEVLWGATYWIVTLFLQLVFGFQQPDVSAVPFIPGLLDEGYINGRD